MLDVSVEDGAQASIEMIASLITELGHAGLLNSQQQFSILDRAEKELRAKGKTKAAEVVAAVRGSAKANS